MASSASTIASSAGHSVVLADLTLPHGLPSVSSAALAATERFLTSPVAARPAPNADRDRYDRLPADVVQRATGDSLRERLLRDGLALVDPLVMSGPCLADSFAAEGAAQRGRRGVWATADLVVPADTLDVAAHLGRYVLVEGTILSVGETKRTVYLNFGRTYRTDFTGLVRRADAKGWVDDLRALQGERVRIRGVLEAWQGGMIRVEHPAQIERLGPQS